VSVIRYLYHQELPYSRKVHSSETQLRLSSMADDRDVNRLAMRFFHGNHFGTDLPNGARYSDERLRDYSRHSDDKKIEVWFEGIENVITALSHTHEVVVGAVAWMTNTKILKALSKNRHVGIVVQKEDFLRRDINIDSYDRWKRKLHSLYDELKPFNMWDFTESYPGLQEET
jgi:hypothetical protein